VLIALHVRLPVGSMQDCRGLVRLLLVSMETASGAYNGGCLASRSILTVPWLELGGRVNLACQKTGYEATIDFHCKPFYGGKKHKVSADIL